MKVALAYHVTKPLSDNLPFTDTWVLDLRENLYRQIPLLSDEPEYREISKEFKKSFSHRPEVS